MLQWLDLDPVKELSAWRLLISPLFQPQFSYVDVWTIKTLNMGPGPSLYTVATFGLSFCGLLLAWNHGWSTNDALSGVVLPPSQSTL